MSTAPPPGIAPVEALRRRVRYAHLWFPGYLEWRLRVGGRGSPGDVWVAMADHFEPLWAGADEETARERVSRWRRVWPRIARRHTDVEGRPPVYSFFYPEEEYRPGLVEPLAEMAREGIADMEVHIHHDGEGEQWFVDTMSRYVETLSRRHGLLRKDRGRLVFGFIHGNWALDNSRPDGRWCGLNNEITLLRDLGCYADFTLPAADSPCQAGPVNAILRVRDDPRRPRSHAHGVPLAPGVPDGDLTLIPGPLGPDWSSRGPLRPRIEAGEVAGYRPSSPGRARLWLRLAPRLGEHAFLKLFTHGAQERNLHPLLENGLDRLFVDLATECARVGARLHFVSAWEMWRLVEAVHRGEGAGAQGLHR
jgi:hypothetical protein